MEDCTVATPLKTRRNNAHYGDKKMIGRTPAAWVKAGKREDFLTAEEFAEDLYGRPVDHIVFKDDKDLMKVI